jgi:hypothetical protein
MSSHGQKFGHTRDETDPNNPDENTADDVEERQCHRPQVSIAYAREAYRKEQQEADEAVERIGYEEDANPIREQVPPVGKGQLRLSVKDLIPPIVRHLHGLQPSGEGGPERSQKEKQKPDGVHDPSAIRSRVY